MSRKRGALATKEQDIILELYGDNVSVEVIAEKLNRTVGPVKRFLADKSITKFSDSEMTDSGRLRQRLKTRPYWHEVMQHYDKEELEYFVCMWIELMQQFKGDVLATEELEIKEWLTVDILKNRLMRARQDSITEISKIQRQIDIEYAREDEHKNPDYIMSLEAQLNVARAAVSHFTNDQMKLQGQVKDIRKDLKAARSDRIKRVEDGRLSFVGLVKMLEDEETREHAGWEAELLSKAADRARTNFSESHIYDDNRIDNPIFNSDVSERMLKEEYEQDTKNREASVDCGSATTGQESTDNDHTETKET